MSGDIKTYPRSIPSAFRFFLLFHCGENMKTILSPRWQYGHEQRCGRCTYRRKYYGFGKGKVLEDRAL